MFLKKSITTKLERNAIMLTILVQNLTKALFHMNRRVIPPATGRFCSGFKSNNSAWPLSGKQRAESTNQFLTSYEGESSEKINHITLLWGCMWENVIYICDDRIRDQRHGRDSTRKLTISKTFERLNRGVNHITVLIGVDMENNLCMHVLYILVTVKSSAILEGERTDEQRITIQE